MRGCQTPGVPLRVHIVYTLAHHIGWKAMAVYMLHICTVLLQLENLLASLVNGNLRVPQRVALPSGLSAGRICSRSSILTPVAIITQPISPANPGWHIACQALLPQRV